MKEPGRPDPDKLLAHVRAEEDRVQRARLKVFLGAAAGVGKTFAMLTEAHERRRAGVDVVVGLVETHGRAETGALLEGLEVLPRRTLEHRGTRLHEFDLDAALARRPALLLLDELAHTNVPGSRHARRWQDVLELLGAGIEVATTLNVQHVESLNDLVAGITGVTVRETVPDSLLDRADEIELVDLPPDDLLQRLREGKVYLPEQAGRAAEGFFRKGNLIALRELALTQAALRVDAEMERYRAAHGLAGAPAIRERLLVCVGDPETGLRLVRATRRMAAALRADWIVAHVEPVAQARVKHGTREHIVDLMGLAEELGAETVMLSGLRVSDEILACARDRRVTRIVVGKSSRPDWLERLAGSTVSALVRRSGDLDVYVMRGEGEDSTSPEPPRPPAPIAWRGAAGALPILGVVTLVALGLHDRMALSNLAMLYLLGVVVTALAFGRGPAILASALGVAAFDFLFVPPRFTFNVSDTEYVVTFAVMLLVAIVIGTLTSRMRELLLLERGRASRANVLHQLSRDLAGRRGPAELLEVACARIAEVFGGRVLVLRPAHAGRLDPAAGDTTLLDGEGHERGVAQWVFDHHLPAGLTTDTLPGSLALHLPLTGSQEVLGVLSVRPDDPESLRDPERSRLLRTFASQVAVALERAALAERTERDRVAIATERTRSTLLSAVSHDLRTPLATILGAATALRDDAGVLSADARRELADSVASESAHLNRLVGNLLDLTRLEAGAVELRREWHSVEDVLGAVLSRLDAALAGRTVRTDVPADLPLVQMDDVWIGQLLGNLLENAVRHTPAGSPLDLVARIAGGWLRIEVCDRGPGLPPGEEEAVFAKFRRGSGSGSRPGAGLGLAIGRAIAEAHGGRLRAAARPGGGTCFRVELPAGTAPGIDPEPEEA